MLCSKHDQGLSAGESPVSPHVVSKEKWRPPCRPGNKSLPKTFGVRDALVRSNNETGCGEDGFNLVLLPAPLRPVVLNCINVVCFRFLGEDEHGFHASALQ